MKAFQIIIALALLQAPTPGRAVLQGRVVELTTTGTIAHAEIVAAKVGGPLEDYRTITADQSGLFVFRDLVPGTYRIYAQHDGFLQAEYGRHAASTAGTPITVSETQTPDIVVTMTPTGVITGHVFENGKPARNIYVRALKPRYFNGERSVLIQQWTQTDDSGEYRLFGLPPASYLVSGVPPPRAHIDGDRLVTPVIPSNANNNRRQIETPLDARELPSAAFNRDLYVTTYYLDANELSRAASVEVRAGQTTTAIDFTIGALTTFRVSGRVTVTATMPPAGITVGVVPVDSANLGRSESIASEQLSEGAFNLAGIPPGSYYLTVAGNVEAVPRTLQINTFVPFRVVDRDVENLVATLRPSVRVSGRVLMNGRPLSANDPRVNVQLGGNAPVLGVGLGVTQPDGSFAFENVSPRDYRLRFFQVGGATWIRSARLGGEDVLNEPIHIDGDMRGRELEIDLSANTATLDALVVDADQRPVPGALVIAVPDFARRQRSDLYRSANADTNGRVHIEGISPGEYRLFATQEIDATAWQDPEVIGRYEARGDVIRFTESGKESLTLKVMP